MVRVGYFAVQSKSTMKPISRTILRANHLGMCFGVRDAISMALHQPEPTTILGDLVHNETVLQQLRSQGVKIQDEVAEITTPSVMITAHGASAQAMERIRRRGLRVLEATCPLVHYAHHAVSRLVREGYHPVIIGKRGHVEVRGLTEDLNEDDVVLTGGDVRAMRGRPRFGVAAQTTQPIERVRHLIALIRKQFPSSEVRFHDTVCQPTKQRQSAAVELAKKSDVVIVIGGAHSNNTGELVNTCSRFCPRVHHVQNASDLRDDWFEDAQTISITAGTSTPDKTIDEVEDWLRRLDSADAETSKVECLEFTASALE